MHALIIGATGAAGRSLTAQLLAPRLHPHYRFVPPKRHQPSQIHRRNR